MTDTPQSRKPAREFPPIEGWVHPDYLTLSEDHDGFWKGQGFLYVREVTEELKAELLKAIEDLRADSMEAAWDRYLSKAILPSEEPTAELRDELISQKDLFEIIDYIYSYYPFDVFPEPYNGCSPDLYSASMARHICQLIKDQVDAAMKAKGGE